MTENKKKLIESLEAWKYSAYYNIFSQQCLHEYFRYFKKRNSVPFDLPGIDLINGGTLKLCKFCSDMAKIDNKKLVDIKKSANTFITRNWLKVFRAVQSYTKNKDYINEFKKENWYHFARLYVNAYSHDYKFFFNKSGKEILPVQYKNEAITEHMAGDSATLKMQIAYELVEDIINFAKRLPE